MRRLPRMLRVISLVAVEAALPRALPAAVFTTLPFELVLDLDLEVDFEPVTLFATSLPMLLPTCSRYRGFFW